ncbi:MAG: SPFH domain-containing protein [Verrucomicrobia bacterium]|nr:SPFH domain-containing protein [Verrucomicrobiota bacterium]
MNAPKQNANQERQITVLSGWLMLPLQLLFLLGGPALLAWSLAAGIRQQNHPYWLWFVVALLMILGGSIMIFGFFTLQPNEARVLVLFGDYRGTVRTSGFHWGNPFYSNGPAAGGHGRVALAKSGEQPPPAPPKKNPRMKISLRARNLNGDRLKVNDKRGNPVEIAAVLVWRVQDTAQAMFDVDDYEAYVSVQYESAVRHLASLYAYDHGEDDETTLRSGVEEVSRALTVELQERCGKAGVVVEEARLTHLAYAPEIAQSMLRRQQAEAVIAARRKIVHGAVSMVEMALADLAEKKVLEFDDERKAAMVSNLMVVLCGESEVHPVVNTGTLYS